MAKKFMLDEINVFDKGVKDILPQMGKNILENTGLGKVLKMFTNPTGKGAMLGGEAISSDGAEDSYDDGYDDDSEDEQASYLYGDDGNGGITPAREEMKKRRKDNKKKLGPDLDYTDPVASKAGRGLGTMAAPDISQPATSTPYDIMSGQATNGVEDTFQQPGSVPQNVMEGLYGPVGMQGRKTSPPPPPPPPPEKTKSKTNWQGSEPSKAGSLELMLERGEISEEDYFSRADARNSKDVQKQMSTPSINRPPVEPSKLTANDRKIIQSMNPDNQAGLNARRDDFLSPEIKKQVLAATGKNISRFSQLKRLGL